MSEREAITKSAAAGRPAGRFLDPKGRATLVVTGLERHLFGDLYHSLLAASWLRLFGVIVTAYVGVNALFACGYLVDRGGVVGARPGSFADAFFFSVQTLATIGYGQMVPRSLFAHVLVTCEALVGLLALAMITGLLFAKFSRPTARSRFRRVAVLAPWNDVPSLMFRMGNERRNQIVEAQLRLVLARDEVTVEGETVRRFHDLPLARSSNAIFALTWTAISPIASTGPLADQTAASLAAARTEILASIIGLDATLNQTVHARHSWSSDEIRWNARFVGLFTMRADGRPEIDYAHFHDVEPLAPPSSGPRESS